MNLLYKKKDPHIFLHCHKMSGLAGLMELDVWSWLYAWPKTPILKVIKFHLYLMCITCLMILASILLLTSLYQNFVKASQLLYQSWTQIWASLLAWYFSSVIPMKFVSSFDTLSLISPLFSVYKHVFNGINLSFVIFNFSVIWNL